MPTGLASLAPLSRYGVCVVQPLRPLQQLVNAGYAGWSTAPRLQRPKTHGPLLRPTAQLTRSVLQLLPHMPTTILPVAGQCRHATPPASATLSDCGLTSSKRVWGFRVATRGTSCPQIRSGTPSTGCVLQHIRVPNSCGGASARNVVAPRVHGASGKHQSLTILALVVVQACGMSPVR